MSDRRPSTNYILPDSGVISWKDDLRQHLGSVESFGDFAVHHRCPVFANPGLQINGAHNIALPLTPGDAEAIKAACREAPLGKGDQAAADTSMRNTWELDPSQFHLANPAWDLTFSELAEDAISGLGLKDATPHLHKLLLCGKGSLLEPVVDSEKEPGPVGTIAVCLPSPHEGGDVSFRVRYDRRKFTTADTSAWHITTVAWFSDVIHDAAELTEGYKLVLIYKLFQTGPAKHSAAFFLYQMSYLGELLREWKDEGADTHALYYILDYQYTGDDLSLAHMRGHDRTICRLFDHICPYSDSFFLLARITRTETLDGYEEPSFTLNTMHSLNGNRIGCGFAVNPDDILNDHKLNQVPDSEDEEGDTEDEDDSRIHYRDTVAMLVPRTSIVRFLPQFTTDVDMVDNMVAMVTEDLEIHECEPTIAAACAFFKKALTLETPDFAQHMAARWAMLLNDKDLLRAVLLTATDRHLSRQFLRTICEHLEGKFGNRSDVDWDPWFKDFSKSCSLELWQIILEEIPRHMEDITRMYNQSDSFKRWGQAILAEKLDATTTFGRKDCEFLIKSFELHDIDSEWITTTLLPALVSRSDRDLLYLFLHTVYKRRHTEPFCYLDRTLFDYLIEHAGSLLMLHEPDIHVDPIRSNMPYATAGPCKEFVTLLDQGLEVGATNTAMRLLEKTYNGLADSLPSWDITKIPEMGLVDSFLHPLARTLERQKVFASYVSDIFELLLRRALQAKLPERPMRRPGPRYEPRRCGAARCAECDALNRFLAADDKRVWKFTGDWPARAHLESLLSDRRLFRLRAALKSDLSGHTLTVMKVKKGFSRQVELYDAAVRHMKRLLRKMQGGFMSDVLGDELYRELVLLEFSVAEKGPEGEERDVAEPVEEVV